MKQGLSIRENVELLLDYYKRDIEEIKQEEDHTVNLYDKSQALLDYNNIITELEYLLKISK